PPAPGRARRWRRPGTARRGTAGWPAYAATSRRAGPPVRGQRGGGPAGGRGPVRRAGRPAHRAGRRPSWWRGPAARHAVRPPARPRDPDDTKPVSSAHLLGTPYLSPPLPAQLLISNCLTFFWKPSPAFGKLVGRARPP